MIVKEIGINSDIPVTDEIVLPSEVLKEMIRKSNYHFIII
jgi:hypothetical protein